MGYLEGAKTKLGTAKSELFLLDLELWNCIHSR